MKGSELPPGVASQLLQRLVAAQFRPTEALRAWLTSCDCSMSLDALKVYAEAVKREQHELRKGIEGIGADRAGNFSRTQLMAKP